MLAKRAAIVAPAALLIAGCAGGSRICCDVPTFGALEVEVVPEGERVRFWAHRTVDSSWAPRAPTPRRILEVQVWGRGWRPLWQVRAADPQAAVRTVAYPDAPPGYARVRPASGPAPALAPGQRYEVRLKDAMGWGGAAFVYRPDAPAP
jgi:hypothetical protein